MDRRAVVVNSLLCFLHNYRHQLADLQLRAHLQLYFPQAALSAAHALLVDLLAGDAEPHKDLLALFDQLSASDQAPLFAAADLSTLPLCLISEEEEDSRAELLREIRQIRTLIQNNNHDRRELTTIDDCCASESACTPKTSKCLVSASSPESPSTSSAAQNAAATSAAALTTTTASSTRRTEPSTGLRLDAAVKKLADRQSKSLDNNNIFGAGSGGAVWPSPVADAAAYMNLLRQWTVPQVGAMSTIFPVLPMPATVGEQACKQEMTCKQDMEMLDDGDEKTLSDDSRSPSEGSNRDEFSGAADSAEKPFECEHANCHKRFANKFLLKKHQFIHTGLRPHSCPFCGKRFNRKDNLLRHKKTHLANALVNAKRRHTMVFGVHDAMLGGLGESSAIATAPDDDGGDDDDL